MTTESKYWAVAQTVSRMEHIVRRDIEKTGHSAFVPTFAKHWKVDDREYSNERPLFTGYVFFLTERDDWAGIPDINGVYRVMPCGVRPAEMVRVIVEHSTGMHDREEPPRFTRYYRKPTKKAARYRRPRPRPGKRTRNVHNFMREANQPCST